MLSSSSCVKREGPRTRRKQWGPGEVIPIHLTISFCTTSFGELVSNIPGVSTTWMSLPNRCACLQVQRDVTDEADVEDMKKSPFKMVLPVALLPLPVFPRSTMRTSSSIPLPYFECPFFRPGGLSLPPWPVKDQKKPSEPSLRMNNTSSSCPTSFWNLNGNVDISNICIFLLN